MGCYIIPSVAAVVHYFVRKKNKKLDKDHYHLWLNLLFFGAAIFGFVDHAWNKELLFRADTFFLDMTLGFAITLSLTIIWVGIVIIDKYRLYIASKVND
jgi:hypothetical protein